METVWDADTASAHTAALYEGIIRCDGTLPQTYHVTAALSLLFYLAAQGQTYATAFRRREPDLTGKEDLLNSPLFTPRNPEFIERSSTVYHQAFRSLLELCYNPYWERVWIIQEIVLSSSPRVLYGRHTLSFEVLSTLVFAVQGYMMRVNRMNSIRPEETYFLPEIRGSIKAINRLTELRQSHGRQALGNGSKPNIDLQRVLFPQLSGSQSTDPRDYIYGLLGMVNKGAGLSIIPDYTFAARDIFIQATVAVLDDSKTLDVLRLNQVTPKKPAMKLPSWAPNWAFGGLKENNWAFMHDWMPSARQDASKGLVSYFKYHDNNILEIESALVDTIIDLCGILPEIDVGTKLEVSKRLVRHWHDWALSAGFDADTFWNCISRGLAFDNKKYLPWRLTQEDTDIMEEEYQIWISQEDLLTEDDWLISNARLHWYSFLIMNSNVQDIYRVAQMFKTASGRLGVAHVEREAPIQLGDEIHIAAGSQRSLVLRRVGRDDSDELRQATDAIQTELQDCSTRDISPLRNFELVSTSYVVGIENGEIANGVALEHIFLV